MYNVQVFQALLSIQGLLCVYTKYPSSLVSVMFTFLVFSDKNIIYLPFLCYEEVNMLNSLVFPILSAVCTFEFLVF